MKKWKDGNSISTSSNKQVTGMYDQDSKGNEYIITINGDDQYTWRGWSEDNKLTHFNGSYEWKVMNLSIYIFPIRKKKCCIINNSSKYVLMKQYRVYYTATVKYTPNSCSVRIKIASNSNFLPGTLRNSFGVLLLIYSELFSGVHSGSSPYFFPGPSQGISRIPYSVFLLGVCASFLPKFLSVFLVKFL